LVLIMRRSSSSVDVWSVSIPVRAFIFARAAS
jgi:hypothetical protein